MHIYWISTVHVCNCLSIIIVFQISHACIKLIICNCFLTHLFSLFHILDKPKDLIKPRKASAIFTSRHSIKLWDEPLYYCQPPIYYSGLKWLHNMNLSDICERPNHNNTGVWSEDGPLQLHSWNCAGWSVKPSITIYYSGLQWLYNINISVICERPNHNNIGVWSEDGPLQRHSWNSASWSAIKPCNHQCMTL